MNRTMGDVFVLILVIGSIFIFIMPICAVVSAGKARRQAEEAKKMVGLLQKQLAGTAALAAGLANRLQRLESANQWPRPAEVSGPEERAEAAPPEIPDDVRLPTPSAARELPPPLAPSLAAGPPPRAGPAPRAAVARPRAPRPRPQSVPNAKIEQFMGAKLFAWVGGLALFLGILFFVKLGIERGWISPALRTAIGFVVGIGLVGAGVVIQRSKVYATMAQTLCSTGVVILYGVSFAAHALYRIPPFDSALVTFGLMALITAVAFLLAMRMEAQVVAILGMLGGFLTPLLCATGRDNPGGLFGYIVLLDIGVLAVAKRQRWLYLTALAAAGTILTQAGWMGQFFDSSQYAVGSATWIPMMVFLGFALVFMLAAWRSRQSREEDLFPVGAALALCGSALLAAFVFLGHEGITERPWLLYSFLLGINGIGMLVVWQQPRLVLAHGIVVSLTFLHLMIWTRYHLSAELLPQALGIYLGFGLLQTGFAALWPRRSEKAVPLMGWTPLIAHALMLLAVLILRTVSFIIWPAILLVDLLIIGLAAMSGALIPVLVALVMTLLTAGVWLFRLPAAAVGSLSQFTQFILVVGGFAVVFGGASAFLSRKMPKVALAAMLPIISAVLPFGLLILATLQLGVGDPSAVFGLALLLVVFLLGLARLSGLTVLVPTALGCVLALEWAWHQQGFRPEHPAVPLLWYLGFYLLFTFFPVVYSRVFAPRRLPWIASAAAGIGTFGLVYFVVKAAWPNQMMGLLPLAFCVAPLLGMGFVLKRHGADNPARLTQLAWLAGVALFFITLIFPLQFEKQWITLGWALEGAALCWLFGRVPHPGLRGTGTALLGAAFLRLALNPAVFDYQVRGETPLLNWQLYAYSLAALAMFLAAAWLKPPNHLWEKLNLRGLFCALGGILLFLLLNIEIADAFQPRGSPSIAFEFEGNFARDMTYTISWALFALGLLGLGIWKRQRHIRYPGLGLLAVALLKLFLHDLANIESIYRIGALIVVAIIALAASYLYQRFLSEDKS